MLHKIKNYEEFMMTTEIIPLSKKYYKYTIKDIF